MAEPGIAAPNTVEDAIVLCGISNTAPIFRGQTPSARVAEQIFDNDFRACMEITDEGLSEDFKSFSELPANEGRLRFGPRIKRNVLAFVHWVQECDLLGDDPTNEDFPIANTISILRRRTEFKVFKSRSKLIAEIAKPQQFTPKMKWEDWAPTFKNFLKSMSSRRGIPLAYVIREDEEEKPYDPSIGTLDNFTQMVPLNGNDYEYDKGEVHTYILRFITGNELAESKVQSHDDQGNGRADFLALRDHFEGVGFHAIEIVKAENTIKNLFYVGEKKGRMWWEKFEKELNKAFAILDRSEGRQVYSDARKLRILLDKITSCDFLKSTIAALNVKLAEVPITLTYDIAITTIRNTVNSKFPVRLNEDEGSRSRRIQALHRNGGRGGRGNGKSIGGKGRSETGGSGGKRKSHPDAEMVRMNDGTMKEIHPSYKFTASDWNNMPRQVAERIKRERNNYNFKRGRKQIYQASTISQMNMRAHDDDMSSCSSITTDTYGNQFVTVPMQQYIQQTTSLMNNNAYGPQGRRNPVNGPHNNDNLRSTKSITSNQNFMGGRNEQASIRSRNTNNNQSGNISLSSLRTGERTVAATKASFAASESPAGTIAANETDSNADTCVLGKNFIILNYTQRSADVYPYDSSYEPMTNVPIVTGATAWDDPSTNITYILVINEGLFYGDKLSHSLLNPNQLRHNGIDYHDNPYDKDHQLCIDIDQGPLVPLKTQGTKIFFNSRVPTMDELGQCEHIELTSVLPWNPSNISLGEVGSNNYEMIQGDDQILYSIDKSLIMIKELSVKRVSKVIEDDHDLHLDVPARRTFASYDRHNRKSIDAIAEAWGIGPLRAAATMKATTQFGQRSAILPLSRRYKADRRYKLRRL